MQLSRTFDYKLRNFSIFSATYQGHMRRSDCSSFNLTNFYTINTFCMAQLDQLYKVNIICMANHQLKSD